MRKMLMDNMIMCQQTMLMKAMQENTPALDRASTRYSTPTPTDGGRSTELVANRWPNRREELPTQTHAGPIIYPDTRQWIRKVSDDGRVPEGEKEMYMRFIDDLNTEHGFSILSSLEAVDATMMKGIVGSSMKIGQACTLVGLVKEDIARAKNREQIV
jgi:hypothetical protein